MTVDRHTIDELLALSLHPALSIFMPAHRGGPETRQGPIRLKNLIREAERQLELRGLAADDAGRLLAPVHSLVDDLAFWRHQAGGLAIYAAPNFFRPLGVPRELREAVTVGDHFHITHLLPALNLERRFYVLALSQKNVRLVEARGDGAREVDLGGLPRNLSAALLYDTPEQEMHPHVTGAVGRDRKAMLPGHGAELPDHKDAIRQFFHRVERGVAPFLADRSTPLVLAAADYLVPLYRDVNAHPSLVPEAIVGNPDDQSARALAAMAWDRVRPHLEAELDASSGASRNMPGWAARRRIWPRCSAPRTPVGSVSWPSPTASSAGVVSSRAPARWSVVMGLDRTARSS